VRDIAVDRLERLEDRFHRVVVGNIEEASVTSAREGLLEIGLVPDPPSGRPPGGIELSCDDAEQALVQLGCRESDFVGDHSSREIVVPPSVGGKEATRCLVSAPEEHTVDAGRNLGREPREVRREEGRPDALGDVSPQRTEPGHLAPTEGVVLADDGRGAPSELAIGVGAQACHPLGVFGNEAKNVPRRPTQGRRLIPGERNREGDAGLPPRVLAESERLVHHGRADHDVDPVSLDEASRLLEHRREGRADTAGEKLDRPAGDGRSLNAVGRPGPAELRSAPNER
jgi:hypothetical protein